MWYSNIVVELFQIYTIHYIWWKGNISKHFISH
jgi:hypothetical protein